MPRILLRLWLAIFFVASAPAAFAAEADPLAEALALPTASGLVGAADRPLFAWVENAAGVRNIWGAERGRPARRLTSFSQDDGQQIYGLTLSPDGSRLAFVRGGDGEFPDEEDLPNPSPDPTTPPQQVFVVATPGGSPQLLGRGHSPVFSGDGRQLAFTRRGELWLSTANDEARRIADVEGDINRLAFSPDGRRLLFSEARGEHSIVALFDLAASTLRYLDAGLGDSVEPVFSPDGNRIAFIRFITPPPNTRPDVGKYWSIRIVDVASGVGRTLWSAPAGPGGRYAGTRSRNLFWSRDGHILFPWEKTGWLHVYALAADRPGEPPRPLTSGTFEVESFIVGPGSSSLVYAANDGEIDRRRVWQRPLGEGRARAVGPADLMLFAPAIGGDAVAAIATSVASPAHPALLDNGRSTPLGAVQTVTDFQPPEAVSFTAEDGVQVRGQLFRARGPGRHPALIYVHGGPRRQMLLGFHPSSYYSNAYILNQLLAARGFNVLAVNYRSGTGYGMASRDAEGTGREGASEYRDILAAGRWLAARDDVDRARIGIWGGSWGGYLTALALARNSDLFAAGVDFHGVHSMLRPLANSLSPEAQLRARQVQWDSSPLAAIDRWRSPVLLIHGDDDRNVDFSQSLVLVRELAARDIPYRELVFANERHGFFRFAHWLESYRATLDFFDQTLVRSEALQ